MDQNRLDEILAQLERYVVHLDPDPKGKGPQYFVDLVATIRNHANAVSILETQLSTAKVQAEKQLRGLEETYTIQFNDLLVNDPSVQLMKGSVELKKAAVTSFLKDHKVKIREQTDQVAMVDAVYRAVSLRGRELERTMKAAENQQRSLRLEIRIGAHYGDERETPEPEDDRQLSLLEGDDFERLLNGEHSQYPIGDSVEDLLGIEPGLAEDIKE